MNLDEYAKELAKDQRVPRNNVLRAQTLSTSFSFKIFLKTGGRKSTTPWLCVRSDLKWKIPIVHASPYLAAVFFVPEI